MNAEPFGNQVLIEPVMRKMIIGESECEYGTVVAVGEDVKKIRIGDVIGYTPWGWNDLIVDDGTPDGKRFRLIPEDARFVLAKLKLS